MRYLISLLLIVTLFNCKDSSKPDSNNLSNPQAVNRETDDLNENSPDPSAELTNVDDIKTEYDYLTHKMRNSSLDSTSFSYNCYEEKKGTVTYYSQNGKLRVIKHKFNEYSHFSGTDEFYLKDNAPFFVYYGHLSWTFDSGSSEQGATKDVINEKRFYIIENKLVKCLEKEFTIKSSASDNTKSSSVPNEEVECPSLDSIINEYENLSEHKNQALLV